MRDLTSPEARDIRVSLLLDQHTLCGNAELAEEIEQAGSALEYQAREVIIRQGDFEDDIYFLIRGAVDIISDGHRHATRSHRCHVGEMALLDPGLGRSADVVSCGDSTVVIRVPGDTMRTIGDRHPLFWRNIGRELAERLRERDRFFVRPNSIPIVFIASSGLAKGDLEIVVNSIEGSNVVCRPWTDPSIFRPSDFTINSLLQQADEADFAIILATPDDLVEKNAGFRGFLNRGAAKRSARDNVLLEYGLFVGAVDRDRVFIFEKSGVGLPSDMQGLTTLRYSNEDELRTHGTRLKSLIERTGSFARMKRTRCM